MQLQDKEIMSILERRFHELDLTGYYAGAISPDGTKLVACTYVTLADINIDEYGFGDPYGHHSSLGADPEKMMKKSIDGTGYHTKTTAECIEEGLYFSFTVKFWGVYYQEEWCVMKETMFFGRMMTEPGAKETLDRLVGGAGKWDAYLFKPTNERMEWKGEQIRSVEEEQFFEAPKLVFYVKSEEKQKVNRTFTAYANASIVEPLLQNLRILHYEEYLEFIRLRGDYSLVFPVSKKYFLIITMARHRELGYRMVYFFHDTATGKNYRWTYPKPRYSDFGYFYYEDPIMDLSPISNWDVPDFLDSSCTMDDDHFWSTYVLKQENGKYAFLEPVD